MSHYPLFYIIFQVAVTLICICLILIKVGGILIFKKGQRNNNCIQIALAEGGNLIVNKDNIIDLVNILLIENVDLL